MKTRIITAAIVALALTPSLASAHHQTDVSGDSVAAQVCQDFNDYGPAEVLATVDDGMGDYLVWLSDVDGDLWACNANAAGDIYANALVTYDILDGEGVGMVQLVSGAPTRDPARQAERLCVAAADAPVKIVATVEDGLGDYLVWLKASDETFVMCNASSDGQLWAFEAVDYPINDAAMTGPASDDASFQPLPSRPGSPTQFG